MANDAQIHFDHWFYKDEVVNPPDRADLDDREELAKRAFLEGARFFSDRMIPSQATKFVLNAVEKELTQCPSNTEQSDSPTP